MRSIEEITKELEQKITDFFVPLQTMQGVNLRKFESLEQCVVDATYALKGEELLPRILLKEIDGVVKILTNEAPFCKTHDLREMAGRIQFLFHLILLGETPDDRQRGVPRII